MGIPSETKKSKQNAAFSKVKQLTKIEEKFRKSKIGSLSRFQGTFSTLPESELLGSQDRISLSMILADMKERTGDLSQMIADRLLSKESALAVKTIQQIIDNFPNHGVIDVFSLYPKRDVITSIIALSRLQRAALYGSAQLDDGTSSSSSGSAVDFLSTVLKLPLTLYGQDADNSYIQDGGNKNGLTNDRELLRDLAYYSAYAHAVYGWKFGLLSGRVHLGDKSMLLRKTGVKKTDIICAQWKSKTHLPAHFVLRDVRRKTIVLCIRGTLSPKDILTDLCCTAEDFGSHEEILRETADDSSYRIKYNYRGRAHQGMLESARGVAEATRKLIASELASKPDYDLVIVGHSLGGGVAAILATLWRETFPNLKVYAYGCPCVGPLSHEPAISNSIVSVVGENDPFSRLSLGHLADASLILSKLCEDKHLRESILNNTKSELDEFDEKELRWCIQAMLSLEEDSKAEKLYPPGKVLYMKGNLFGNVDNVTLYEVDQEVTFKSLRWHPRMFDLSLHVPHRYETLLSRMWEKVKYIRIED